MNYAELAETYLDITSHSGDELMARCPFHDDSSASLQFNIKKGLFICFSCQEKGTAKKLVEHFGGRYQDPDIAIADIYKKLDLIEMPSDGPQTARVLPERTLKRYAFPTDYWASRGLSSDVVEVFGLGYDPIENDAIIPVRNIDGGLIGVIRRRLEEGAMPKYLYYRGFPRSTSLFASWLVARTLTDSVVITEGSLDAISVWQGGFPAVAQYGSSLSSQQAVILRRLGIARVVLFFDNDRAGKQATDHAVELLRDFFVSVVTYDDRDPKDPGGMTPEMIAAKVENAMPII